MKKGKCWSTTPTTASLWQHRHRNLNGKKTLQPLFSLPFVWNNNNVLSSWFLLSKRKIAIYWFQPIWQTLVKLDDLPRYLINQKYFQNHHHLKKKFTIRPLLTSFTCSTCSAALHAFVFLHSCNCRRVPLRTLATCKASWNGRPRGKMVQNSHIGPSPWC